MKETGFNVSNITFDPLAYTQLFEEVNFRSANVNYSGFSITGESANTFGLNYIDDLSIGTLVYYGGVNGDWERSRYRYIQFGEEQEVSTTFKEFMMQNASELGDYAIEPGDYCVVLDPYDAIQEFAPTERNIPINLMVGNSNVASSGIQASRGLDTTGTVLTLGGVLGWYYSNSAPAQFRPFGWIEDAADMTFQNRYIKVLNKTYLSYDEYVFLTKILIPLNTRECLDTLGILEVVESMKRITDLTIKYAKYMRYTPVADTLYYNESGQSSVTGLDFSKYLFVTIRSRACSTFIRPTSTSFAVKTISDCGGSFILQIADPAQYVNLLVSNTSITVNKASSGGNLIYEIIGYRWDTALEAIPEKEEPEYSYQYVQGQLTCTPGNKLNNFYNSDHNTEFRVELNFYINELNVELVNNTARANNYWKLSVNSNGHLVMQNNFNGTARSATWTKTTIAPKTWYSLSLYSNNLTSTNYQNTAGQVKVSIVNYGEAHTEATYSMQTIGSWSQFSTKRSMYIGGTEVKLRDTILIKGTAYHSGVTNTQNILNVNINDAPINSPLSLSYGDFLVTGGLVTVPEEV